MPMRRISESELKAKFKEEERRENAGAIRGVDGKPLNARKKKGASKTIMESAIVAKLYKDGVILRRDDESYVVDFTRAGDYPGGVDTENNIRAILKKIVAGLEEMGHVVEAKHVLSGVIDTPEIPQEQLDDETRTDRPDSEGRNNGGGVRRESLGGVRDGRREGDPSDAPRGVDSSGDTGSAESGGVSNGGDREAGERG